MLTGLGTGVLPISLTDTLLGLFLRLCGCIMAVANEGVEPELAAVTEGGGTEVSARGERGTSGRSGRGTMPHIGEIGFFS